MEHNQDELFVFECEKHHCRLTAKACAERRVSVREHRGRYLPVYPECQDCSQYYNVQKNRVLKKTPRSFTKECNREARSLNKTAQEDFKMGHGKINKKKLEEMFKSGKTDKEMADFFGVGEGGVWAMRKKLGLKREKRQSATKSSEKKTVVLYDEIPAQAAQPIPVFAELKESPGQVIPVTLRIMVEIDVMVNRG